MAPLGESNGQIAADRLEAAPEDIALAEYDSELVSREFGNFSGDTSRGGSAGEMQMVGDDVTVQLEGTFDWTQSFANIAWSLGSDGIAETDDDYSIAAPPGFEDVTIGAANLGDAVIQGPGDVPTLDWETFLGMWDGTYFGWTVENLDI